MKTPYSYNDEGKNHIHLINGEAVSGVSSVMNVIAKPLNYWVAGKTLELFGWRHPDKCGPQERRDIITEVKRSISIMDTDSYDSLLKRAYKAHAEDNKKTQIAGKELHKELENYIKVCLENNNGRPWEQIEVLDSRIDPFVRWAVNNVDHFLWSEAHCFSQSHKLGGISDAGAILKDGAVCIFDFKSSREAYITHFWQCAGYDICIEENGLIDREGNTLEVLVPPITKYLVIPFGAELVIPQEFVDTRSAREAFLAALVIKSKMP